MRITDNPHADFDRWDSEQEKALEHLPKCEYCEQRIQEDEAVCIDGDWFCRDCEEEAWIMVRADYLQNTY